MADKKTQTAEEKRREDKFSWKDGDIVWTKPPKLNKPAAKAKKTPKAKTSK